MNQGDSSGRRDGMGDLHRRAEARLARSDRASDIRSLSTAGVEALVHELQTHQVELELQNEELREAQLALTEAHDRYLDLYDFAPVGYVTVDGGGKIIEANLRAAELFGLPRAELIECRFSTLVAGDDQDALFQCTRKLRSEGGRHEVDLRLRSPDSALLWARTEWVQTEGEERPHGARVTLSDLTQHKQLQAQLALTDRLSSVGLLAASIAHEVNNPLTYVLYNLESIAGDLPKVIQYLADRQAVSPTVPADERARGGWIAENRIELDDIAERAASAVEGAHRIRDLVKAMGALSRVDEDLIESLSLNTVIETSLSMTSREISCRARLIKNLGDVPRISANHGQLCQLFVNLLVNAAHAIEEGHADENEIAVRTWSEQGEVLAEILDTGCGIPTENIGKVFDPFFTTKPAGSGTGLGLSVCMKIVNTIGGRLSVDSRDGKGTKFTIRLPASTAAQEAATEFEAEPKDEMLRGRILVIDDEDSIRRTVSRMLRDHEVVVAASGQEGMDIISRDPEFDVILCDLMMPDLSGMDLWTWLNARGSPLLDRFVFITGGAFTPATREFLAKTDPTVLRKPFDLDQLLRMVQRTMVSARGL